MGLWNMLTHANKNKGGGEGNKRKDRDRKSCGGNTLAAAVVFHLSLERVGVHLSLGARKHGWSHDHQATLCTHVQDF